MSLSDKQRENFAYYAERYTVTADYPLVAERPVRLLDHLHGEPQRCRFCGRAKPEATFRNAAHAVPEFLGNQSLLSLNECDGCNARFASKYEDHLAKWFGPFRTVSQIRGKKGVPTYKSDEIRIEMGAHGLNFTIINADLMKSQLDREGPIAFTLPVETPSQPYVPIRAAMALVKVACSVCPADDLAQCQPAIDWLMGRAILSTTMFPVLHAFTPGPNPYGEGKVMMLRRKVNEPIPYLWCIVATANYRFQFFVPFCPNDVWLKSGDRITLSWEPSRNKLDVLTSDLPKKSRTTVRYTSKLFLDGSCRHYPVPFGDDWPHGKTEYSPLNWSGTELEVRDPAVTLNVDRAERIDRL